MAFAWGHARMGVLQAAAAWIRQCIGIKKKGVVARSDETATGSTARRGKRGEGRRRGRSSRLGGVRLEGESRRRFKLPTILTSLVRNAGIFIGAPDPPGFRKA